MQIDRELTTLFTGRNLIELELVDSTNTFLAELVSNTNCAEGTVVLAKGQNAGRGQSGQRWESEFGLNILISIYFRPAFIHPKQLSLLNQGLALGIYDFLKKYTDEKLSLKWPNDIYYGDKKMGGILIENTFAGSKVNTCILGFGLNVNQKSFPSLPFATSLSLVTGKEFLIKDLIAELLNAIEQRYLSMKAGKFYTEEYCSKLYRFGKLSNYSDSSGAFKATIKGVDENGQLCLERTNGNFSFFDIKQVTFLPD